MHEYNKILQLTVPSDIGGQPLGPNGPIGLYHIRFNLSEWQAPGDQMQNSIALVDGYEIVIRRKGRTVEILRSTVPIRE